MNLVKKDAHSIVDEFLSNFTKQSTMIAYRRDIHDFLKYSNDLSSTVDKLQILHFIGYRDHLIAQGNSPATVNRKLSSLKSLMNWCVTRGFLPSNPVAHLKMPKVVTRYPTIAFTDEEAKKLIDSPDVATFAGNTHKLALTLLLFLGLRRSELVNIRLRDIYEDRNFTVLKVRGKGDKERILPLSEALLEAVSFYKQNYCKYTKNTLELNDFLLQSNISQKNTNPIDPSTIFKLINRYTKKLGINKRVGAHSCRATVISHLLEKNISPRDVADFAGHTNIQTTVSIYDKKRDYLKNSAAAKVNYGT